MATAKLFKANLNWMVRAEGGEQIMGNTPEAATEQFKALWAQHYQDQPCPEIVRDEASDISTNTPAPAAPDSVGQAPTGPVNERAYELADYKEALKKGELEMRRYAPSYSHPLLAEGMMAPTIQEAILAVRNLETALSNTTGRTIKLLQ